MTYHPSIKDSFTSRFGTTGWLVSVDLSQIEIVYLAWLCQDVQLIEDITNGLDLHCVRYAAAIDRPYKEVYYDYKSGVEEVVEGRRRAKEFSFQRSYGASAKAIAENTGLTVGAVKKLMRAEDDRYPAVANMYNMIHEDLKGYVEDNRYYGVYSSPSGREYSFEYTKNKYSDTMEPYKPSVLNYPVQGGSADVMKLLAISYYNNIGDSPNIKMINCIHDELLFDVKNDVALQELNLLTQAVFEEMPDRLGALFKREWNVPLRYDIEAGKSWSTLQPLDTLQINI